MREAMQLPSTWSDLVIFSHRDYRASRAYIVLKGRSDVRDFKKPPNPPPPSRFMISTGDDFGNVKVVAPKTEPLEESTSSSEESSSSMSLKIEPSTDETSSTRVKSEPRCLSPVGLMARDPDGPNPGEVVIDSDTDVEVHEHGPIDIQPHERTTMGKRRRRMVLDGISQLNQHDKMIQLGFGLTSSSISGQKTVVFTSHPLVFLQESGDAVVDVLDVGVGASHLNSVGDPKDWCKLVEGYHNIVFAIGYDNPEDPLLHGALLAEVETTCELEGCKFLHIDVSMTGRWEMHHYPQTPYINDHGLAFTCNDEQWSQDFESWFRGQTMDDVLSWKFADWIGNWAKENELDHQMGVAFVGDMEDEVRDDGEPFDALRDSGDRAQVNPVEELISEDTLLDEVEIPGLPQDEVERRRKWRKLPARVRIAVRRLHRQFGHVPRQTMIHLLRAARIRQEFIDAVKLHRCPTCEETAHKKPTHKTALPHNYSFNHSLGIDVFEIVDMSGSKFQVLNMVDLGTTFQLCEVVRSGAGQPSSNECLKALQKRWFSWCGHPVNLMCDRGLHNRGVLAKYMDEHGIQVHHSPLEAPENIGRVERHGGIAKALFRKVSRETQPLGREQVESVLQEVCTVKNNTSRVGGFSPSQWVLGKAPRLDPSPLSEERFAELGAIEAQHNPESIFAFQHLARQEAQKAFVYLDCSKRVQRAMTKNASPFPRVFEVGDLVTFRRDNQRGGTRWSPTCRVIGHEGERNIWLLCGNVPVLVASQNVKIATPNEALAHAVLHGQPVIPEEVVSGNEQQSFLDARAADDVASEGYSPSIGESPEQHVVDDSGGSEFPFITWGDDNTNLPPIPEDEDFENDRIVRPDFFEDENEESEGADATEELAAAASSNQDRRRTGTAIRPERNVRPRTESREGAQPESERGSSFPNSRRESTALEGEHPAEESRTTPAQAAAPRAWPNPYESLDDLPASLRRHFQQARENAAQWTVEEVEDSNAMFSCFMTGIDSFEEEGKKVLKSIHYESAPPDVQKGLQNSRAQEWAKFESFGAVVPLTPDQVQELIAEGHQIIPSKWVDVDKAQYKKGRDPNYQPQYKSRLVSCGNFECSEGLRSDSPTADIEVHNLVCCWCAINKVDLHSADVTSAYFQGRPLDRVLMMRQPRGGLPGVEEGIVYLVRVPIYGLTDSGRGFWLRLDGDAKLCGMKASQFFPGLYYLPGSNGDACALMCTHVDDLLYCYLPEGKDVMDSFLAKFNIGSTETNNFRYCGKQFDRSSAGDILVDTVDNTRKIRPITFDAKRVGTERITGDDITRLRSVTGSLAWIARQTRPDLAYRVSRLQSSIKNASVATLADANAVVQLAHKGDQVKLRFPRGHLNWNDVGVITITDASFSNEKDYKSQQGRCHFLGDRAEIKDTHCYRYRVMPLSFSSTTIRRVCRSTLQAETYALQNGLETGDKLRGVLAEIKGQIRSMKTWELDARSCVPHLSMTDCRSLSDHLASEILAKVSDKRLGIELQSIHESFWSEGEKTWTLYPKGGDRLQWIATHTMISDCLTKSMKPDFIVRVLYECTYKVQKQ